MITTVFSWVQTALLAVLPWLARSLPWAAPAAAAIAVLIERPWRSRAPDEPWRSLVVVASAAVCLVVTGGWPVAGAWVLLALVVGAGAWWMSPRGGPRPDVVDVVALLGWAGAFVVHPGAVSLAGGGWVAPLLLVVAARRIGEAATGRETADRARPCPPEREIRGALRLAGVVLAGEDGLARSVPLDLDLEAGESAAVLCDDAHEASALAETLSLRRRPLAGEVLVDGVPAGVGERLAAVIGAGERYVAGTVEENLATLSEDPVGRGELAALEEACSLDEVRREAGDSTLGTDGAPLSPFHRLLVQAARVIPSHYRVLVVVDPAPWVNRVRAELWRAAVVRASVGRTAVWVTADRSLAARADRLLEWKHGSLKPVVAREGDE